MVHTKIYNNGLRLVVVKMEGFSSVAVGVFVNTGSANESAEENGISHFIEHTVFKGTEKRSSFEISEYIDNIGASINAYTAKQTTCFYTKSTAEHFKDCAEVLSDIFFNAKFDSEDLKKEKGVILEEINMSEDTPDDICFDLLAESYYGKNTYGQAILGTKKNVKKFTKEDVKKYMDKYYTADNVVISVAGNVDIKNVEDVVNEYFAEKFVRTKSAPQCKVSPTFTNNFYKYKKIEQAHICFALKGISVADERIDEMSVAIGALGGGMSSRLFQKVREELGLAYSVYAFTNKYSNSGNVCVYAGVNKDSRDLCAQVIIDEIKKFKKDGITQREFETNKEQIKSSLIMGQENTHSQMALYGRFMTLLNQTFDYDARYDYLIKMTKTKVDDLINEFFDLDTLATATVGRFKKPLSIIK